MDEAKLQRIEQLEKDLSFLIKPGMTTEENLLKEVEKQ